MDRILIGSSVNPIAELTNATIISCSAVLTSSLSGSELAIDQFMPVVYSAAYVHVGFIPRLSSSLITSNGLVFKVMPGEYRLDNLPYATPIWYFSNGNLVGKFYCQKVVRTGKTEFSILAVSAVGILDGRYHEGDIYTGNRFEDVAASIIGDGFEFSCDDDVKNIQIYGWLPYDTRRSNLHQLLFATGVALYKDENGDIVFRYPDTTTVKNIPSNRIFYGGSVDYKTPYTRADVTEHTFEALATDDTVTLFDNTNGSYADNYFVTFREPMHDLSVTGSLSIVRGGVNCAVVSGVGTLLGKRYTHVTRIVSDTNGESEKEKTVSVTDATLVTVANSENVLKRVLNYYSSARIINNDIVIADELPGDQVTFENPFNEREQAYISTLSINASSFARASAEMITGYTPSGGGNNYSKATILTGNGVWTASKSGKIRVAVLQGGTGGAGGMVGTDGELVDNGFTPGNGITLNASKNVGVGGLAGAGGLSGKVFVVNLDVTEGQQFSYSSGAGGIGGQPQMWDDNRREIVQEATAGSEGEHSSFGEYSSENGVHAIGGYFDIINNEAYALDGNAGSVGGNGFAGSSTTDGRGEGNRGGSAGSGLAKDRLNYSYIMNRYNAGGGGAGGDSGNVAGQYGQTFIESGEEDLSRNIVIAKFASGAAGGNGATPTKRTKPTKIGCGGDGGHGGGGGGTGGTVYMYAFSGVSYTYVKIPAGKGGNGGAGGDGADGGIIIYE